MMSASPCTASSCDLARAISSLSRAASKSLAHWIMRSTRHVMVSSTRGSLAFRSIDPSQSGGPTAAGARKRQDWLQASAQVTWQLLSAEGEEPLQPIARQARQIADADIVTVVLPTPTGQRFMVEVASGARAEDFTGMTYPVQNTLVELVSTTRRPVPVSA